MKLLPILLLLSSALMRAAIIYDSTISPNGLIDPFFDNNLVEAGDQVRFAGTERMGVSAVIGLFDVGGTGGTADVTLRLYNVAADGSVGGLVLAPITNQVTFGVDPLVWWLFPLAGVTLPDEVIWTVSFANAGSLILGLQNTGDVFTGSSSADFVMWNTGSGLAPLTTGFGQDNYIARFYAVAVPEPAALALTGVGLIVLSCLRRRRKADYCRR